MMTCSLRHIINKQNRVGDITFTLFECLNLKGNKALPLIQEI